MSNNIGIDILAKENLPQNIEKLSAQREVYTRAKQILSWQVILTVPIIIFLSLLKLFLELVCDTKIEWLVSTYALILFFIDSIVLNHLIKSMKEKAAGIQELFDCEVLSIEWNKMLFAEKPENSDIHKYHTMREERNVSDDFINWYSEPIKHVENNVAKIICQRENINYDIEIRKNFMEWVVIISIFTLIILIFLSAISDFAFRTFIISGITPFLPVFGIAIKWYFEQQNSIKTLREVKSAIENIWSKALENNEIPSNATIRQIQDRIHLHRREGALVPDYIYNKIRVKREKQMYFSVNASVQEYQKARTL